DHVRQMAAQYGGQSEALQAILKYVNQLAYIEGINDAFWIATGLAFLAFVLSLFLKGKKGADAEHERMMHAESNKFK
ncbi:MFS transporter, partial [Staphylococcus aureus]|nr:MFS transporter [Staphylococcus aureus]